MSLLKYAVYFIMLSARSINNFKLLRFVIPSGIIISIQLSEYAVNKMSIIVRKVRYKVLFK